jgi:hypothetical protein
VTGWPHPERRKTTVTARIKKKRIDKAFSTSILFSILNSS